MHLVQILLPLYDNAGHAVPRHAFERVRQELVARFGGLTAYSRAPARGLWKDEDGGEHALVRDDIVVYEVMAQELDRAWWAAYRAEMARRFGQEELIVRAQAIELL